MHSKYADNPKSGNDNPALVGEKNKILQTRTIDTSNDIFFNIDKYRPLYLTHAFIQQQLYIK